MPKSNQFILQIKKFIRLYKFILVGGSSAFISFIALILCIELLHFPSVVSYVISYITGLLNSFYFNTFWTFSDKKRKKLVITFSQFVTVYLFGLLFYVSFMQITVGIFKIMYPIATIIAGILLLIWNYLLSSKWTYK